MADQPEKSAYLDQPEAVDAEKSADMDQVALKSEYTVDTDPRVTAFSYAEQKKIIRRIDLRLVLTLGLMYMISLMDRTNLGAASVAG